MACTCVSWFRCLSTWAAQNKLGSAYRLGATLNRYGLDKGWCVKTPVFDGVHMRFLISVFVDLGCAKQTRKCVQVEATLNRYGLDKGWCVKTHVFDGVRMRFLISVLVQSSSRGGRAKSRGARAEACYTWGICWKAWGFASIKAWGWFGAGSPRFHVMVQYLAIRFKI